MALNAAALRLMANKGLSAADIVEIAEALEVRRDPGAAARQQRRRDRLRTAGADGDPRSRDVTRDPSPKEKKSNPLPESPSPDGDSTPLPDRLFAAWNAVAGRSGLRAAAQLTAERRRAIRARLAEHGEDGFRRAIDAAGAAPFCCGKNDRGWRADLDFLLQPRAFVRLIEGFYGGETETLKTGEWSEERKAALLASIRERDAAEAHYRPIATDQRTGRTD